jgi:hypothetical protein
MVAIERIDIILTIDLFIHKRNSREIRDIARVVHGCLRVKSDQNHREREHGILSGNFSANKLVGGKPMDHSADGRNQEWTDFVG